MHGWPSSAGSCGRVPAPRRRSGTRPATRRRRCRWRQACKQVRRSLNAAIGDPGPSWPHEQPTCGQVEHGWAPLALQQAAVHRGAGQAASRPCCERPMRQGGPRSAPPKPCSRACWRQGPQAPWIADRLYRGSHSCNEASRFAGRRPPLRGRPALAVEGLAGRLAVLIEESYRRTINSAAHKQVGCSAGAGGARPAQVEPRRAGTTPTSNINL